MWFSFGNVYTFQIKLFKSKENFNPFQTQIIKALDVFLYTCSHEHKFRNLLVYDQLIYACSVIHREMHTPLQDTIDLRNIFKTSCIQGI